MRDKWEKVVLKVIKHPSKVGEISCPNCRKKKIEYLYNGEAIGQVGYLMVWCKECLKGTYVSRVKIPENINFVSRNEGEGAIPIYEIEM